VSQSPFLESTDRGTPQVGGAAAARRGSDGWSLIDRPAPQHQQSSPTAAAASQGHRAEVVSGIEEEAEAEAEINSGSEPWVTIDKVHPQQASPRTAHASSAEVDRYIDEEFELTKNSAREYVVTAASRI
jgi:hypothetical protein